MRTLVRRDGHAPPFPLARACAALALLAGGCGTGQPDIAPAIVRDSAGVRIVQNIAPSWSDDQAWRVDPEPVLRIGAVQGDSAYQFFRIRAVDVLSDGGLVVLDGGSMELRRYDPDGRHLWSAGGRGNGPGQFEQPSYLGHDRDGSFALWDRALNRLTFIGSRGDSIRSTSLIPASGPPPVVYGIFDDGALLATFPNMISPPSPGAILTDTINLWRFDHAGDERRLLTRLPGPSWMWTGRYQLPVPLTMNPLRAVAGMRLVTASGTFAEIQIHESTGGLVERDRLPQEPEAMTRAEVRRMVDDWIERGIYSGPATVWDEWFDRMPIPDQRPAFDRLLLDDAGNIWVRRFATDMDSTVAPTWDVVAPDGLYRGVILMPPGLEVMAIGASVLAGVSRDSLDVEYVTVHRITKQADVVAQTPRMQDR